MAEFKNTTFREGYNPSLSEFKKTHGHLFNENEIEKAYEVVTGKKPKNKDGNTTTAIKVKSKRHKRKDK